MELCERDLLALAKGGEGKNVELKRGLQSDETIARTLVAFANTAGGLLVIGVDDQRKIVGAAHAETLPRRLHAIARSRCEPPVAIAVGSARALGRTVVVCAVPISRRRPHVALREDGQGEVLVRRGSSNRRASSEDAQTLRVEPAVETPLDALESAALEWLASRAARPEHDTSSLEFAAHAQVSHARARRALRSLEERGRAVGFGPLTRRCWISARE